MSAARVSAVGTAVAAAPGMTIPTGHALPTAPLPGASLDALLGPIGLLAMLATLVALVTLVVGLVTERRSRTRQRAIANPEGRRDLRRAVAPELAILTDPDQLLCWATRRARELFDAEDCSLSVLDGGRRTLYLSTAAGGSHVDDGQHARLRVPLRAPSAFIGVIEVADPRPGHFSPDDEALLEELASAVAVAYEHARDHERTGDDAIGLRRLGVVAGFGLLAVGLLLLLGTLSVQQAWAVPLAELPARPGLWSGLASALAGALLVGFCRRSRRARDPEAAAHRSERSYGEASRIIRGGHAA